MSNHTNPMTCATADQITTAFIVHTKTGETIAEFPTREAAVEARLSMVLRNVFTREEVEVR